MMIGILAGFTVNAVSTDGTYQYYYFHLGDFFNESATIKAKGALCVPGTNRGNRLQQVNATYYANASTGVNADNYDQWSGSYYGGAAQASAAGASVTLDVYTPSAGTYNIWMLAPYNNAPTYSIPETLTGFATFTQGWTVSVNGGEAQAINNEDYDYDKAGNVEANEWAVSANANSSTQVYAIGEGKVYRNQFYWDSVAVELNEGKNEITLTAAAANAYISAMLVTNNTSITSNKFAYIGQIDMWTMLGEHNANYGYQDIVYFADGQYHENWASDGFINLIDYSDSIAPTVEIAETADLTDNSIKLSWTAADEGYSITGAYTPTCIYTGTMASRTWNKSGTTKFSDASGIYETRIYENDVLLTTITDGTTSYTFNAPYTGSAYNFKVEVTDHFGYKATDTAVFSTTGASDTTGPNWPADAEITVANASFSSTITWPAATDDREVYGYDVYVGEYSASEPETNLAKSVTAATRSYTVSLEPGESKEVSVVAVDRAGNRSDAIKATVKASSGEENYLIRPENFDLWNTSMWFSQNISGTFIDGGMFEVNSITGQYVRGKIAGARYSNATMTAEVYIDTPGVYTAFMMLENNGETIEMQINDVDTDTVFGGKSETNANGNNTWEWQKAQNTWNLAAGWNKITVIGSSPARFANIFLTNGTSITTDEITYVRDSATLIKDNKLNVALYEDPVAPIFADGDVNATYNADSNTVALTWPAATDEEAKPDNAASSSTYTMQASGFKKYNIYVNDTLVGTPAAGVTTFTVTAENLGREIVENESLLIEVGAVDAFGSTATKSIRVIASENVYTYENYKYIIADNKATIVGVVESPSGEITVPAEIDGVAVTDIGENAFDACSSITKVTISEGVTKIGANAFNGCSGLTSVVIPKSVTTIGENAFYGCSSLTGVYITDLAAWCAIEFANVNSNPLYYAKNLYLNNVLVTELEITEGVTKIGAYAFNRCSGLTSVVIPKSVTTIGTDAFYGCSSLTGVYITDVAAWCGIEFANSTANPLYYAKNLYLNNVLVTELEITEGVTTIGAYAFNGCSGLTSVTMPDGVTSIGAFAFNGCSGLTSITIPDSVTIISGYTFNGCSGLTSVVIPKSVTTIGAYAFNGCSSLTSITIPSSVALVSNYAFSGCTSLETVYYNGKEEQFNKIDIYDYNDSFVNANKVYFAYVTIYDHLGNVLSKKMQSWDSLVDISGVSVEEGKEVKLYTDKDYTLEFSLDTPITDNLELYANTTDIYNISATGTYCVITHGKTIVSGGDAVFTVMPKFGYMIDKVTLDGVDVTSAFDVYNGGTYTVYNVAEDVDFEVICKEIEINEDEGITTTDIVTLPSVFVPADANGDSVGAITFGKVNKDASAVKEYGIEIKDETGADVKTKSGKGPRFKTEKSNANGQYAIEFSRLPAGKYKIRTYIEYTDGSIKYGAPVEFEVE